MPKRNPSPGQNVHPTQQVPGQNTHPGHQNPTQNTHPTQQVPGQNLSMLSGQQVPRQSQSTPPGQQVPGENPSILPGQEPPRQNQSMLPGQLVPGQLVPGQLVPRQNQSTPPGQLVPRHNRSTPPAQQVPGEYQNTLPRQQVPGQTTHHAQQTAGQHALLAQQGGGLLAQRPPNVPRIRNPLRALPAIVHPAQFPYPQSPPQVPLFGFSFAHGYPVDATAHYDAVPVGTYIVRFTSSRDEPILVWRAAAGGRWEPVHLDGLVDQVVLLPFRE